MLGRSLKGRGVGFEQLERRNLMAGNVTASLVDGDLVIKGDDYSNSVVVTQFDSKTFEVSGRAAGGSDTKINGKVGARVRVTGVIDDIRAQFYSGSDGINLFGRRSHQIACHWHPASENCRLTPGSVQVRKQHFV